MNADEIKNLRDVMGTNPASGMERKDEIFRGSCHINVKMIDSPKNPYEAIYEGVTATWGNEKTWGNKYERTSDKGRLITILATLGRKTLAEILEAPKFTFAIDGASRAAFDQYARHRIGVGINSVGTRDNDWMDASIRLPNEVTRNPQLLEAHIKAFEAAKDAYEMTVKTNKESWQSGRFILPMGTVHRWVMSANYLALQNMSFQRMKFCEQFDTVAVMWHIREAIKNEYPLLAAFMRPGCDWSGSCQYHSEYGLSELFGCLFTGCGRHAVKGGEKYTEFNRACSTPKEIEEDTGIHIVRKNEWEAEVLMAVHDDQYLGLGAMGPTDIKECMDIVAGGFK